MVAHCIARYGKKEVVGWNWEVWNEPDIPYWHGPPEEYDKLYDYAVGLVRRLAQYPVANRLISIVVTRECMHCR